MLLSSLFCHIVVPPEEGDAESMYLSLTKSSQYSSKAPSFKFHEDVSLLLHGVKIETCPPPTALPSCPKASSKSPRTISHNSLSHTRVRLSAGLVGLEHSGRIEMAGSHGHGLESLQLLDLA